jgi:hypothetical protein
MTSGLGVKVLGSMPNGEAPPERVVQAARCSPLARQLLAAALLLPRPPVRPAAQHARRREGDQEDGEEEQKLQHVKLLPDRDGHGRRTGPAASNLEPWICPRNLAPTRAKLIVIARGG